MSTSLAGLPLVCPSCRAPLRAGPRARAARPAARASRCGTESSTCAPGRVERRASTRTTSRRSRRWSATTTGSRPGARWCATCCATRPRRGRARALRHRLRQRRPAGVPGGERRAAGGSLRRATRRASRSCAGASRPPLLLVDEGRFPPLGPGSRCSSLFDVLEHIDDDRGTLGHLIEILDAGRRAGADRAGAPVPLRRDGRDRAPPPSLHPPRARRKLRGAGFRVLRLAHFMAPLVPLVLRLRLAGAALPRRGAASSARQAGAERGPGPERPDERAAAAGASAGARLAAAVRLVADRRGRAAARGRCNIGPADRPAARRHSRRPADPGGAAADARDAARARAAAGARRAAGRATIPPRPSTCAARRSAARSSASSTRPAGSRRPPARTRCWRAVEAFNRRPEVHGILVQLPLPQQVDAQRVLDRVRPGQGRRRLPSRRTWASWCRSARASWPARRRGSWSC